MSGALKDFTAVEFVAKVKDLVIPSSQLAFHIVKGLGGTQEDAQRGYRLAQLARDERDTWRHPGADGQLRAVVQAVMAHLIPATKRGPRGKLPLAVELAICRAIVQFGTERGQASLASSLLGREGFLADPEIAGILALALTGGYGL